MVTSRRIKHCTEVRNIEFIPKQPRQFFVFTFLLHCISNSCPYLYINHDLFLNSFSKILIINLSLPLKWSVHDTFINPPPHPIHLLICFELSITRTLFDFPRRFELSGVDNYAHDIGPGVRGRSKKEKKVAAFPTLLMTIIARGVMYLPIPWHAYLLDIWTCRRT